MHRHENARMNPHESDSLTKFVGGDDIPPPQFTKIGRNLRIVFFLVFHGIPQKKTQLDLKETFWKCVGFMKNRPVKTMHQNWCSKVGPLVDVVHNYTSRKARGRIHNKLCIQYIATILLQNLSTFYHLQYLHPITKPKNMMNINKFAMFFSHQKHVLKIPPRGWGTFPRFFGHLPLSVKTSHDQRWIRCR